MKNKIIYKIKKFDINIKIKKINNNLIIINKDNNLIKLKLYNKILKKNQLNFFLKKLKNNILSLQEGWCIELLLKGIGYKSFYIKKKLILDLGYSNLITYELPKNISIWNLKTKLIFFSSNKNLLNNIIFQIKKFSLPEIYTGKGILLKNEIIKIKNKAVR